MNDGILFDEGIKVCIWGTPGVASWPHWQSIHFSDVKGQSFQLVVPIEAPGVSLVEMLYQNQKAPRAFIAAQVVDIYDDDTFTVKVVAKDGIIISPAYQEYELVYIQMGRRNILSPKLLGHTIHL